MSLYHAKWSYWKFSTRIDCKYSNKKKKKIPNIGHSQFALRIIALTFLTKNVSNESAFLVQMGHPYRAFLRNQIRMNYRVPSALTVSRVPRVPSASTVPRVPRVPIPLTVPTGPRVPTLPAVPTAPTAPTSTASKPSGESLYWFS